MHSGAPRTTRKDVASEGDRGTLTRSGGEDRNFPSLIAYQKPNKPVNTVHHPLGDSSLWICCCPPKKVRYLLSKQITRLARIQTSARRLLRTDWRVSLTVLVLSVRGCCGASLPSRQTMRSAMQSAWKPPLLSV